MFHVSFLGRKRKNPHISPEQKSSFILRWSCCWSVSIFSVFKHAAWRWLLSENKISFFEIYFHILFWEILPSFLSMHCGISIAILWLSTIPPHNIWGQTEKVASPINIHQLVVTKIPFSYWCCTLIYCVIEFVFFRSDANFDFVEYWSFQVYD